MDLPLKNLHLVQERLESPVEGCVDFIREVVGFYRQENQAVLQAVTYGGNEAVLTFSFCRNHTVHISVRYSEQENLSRNRIIAETENIFFMAEETESLIILICGSLQMTVKKKPYSYTLKKNGITILGQAWNDFNVDGRYKKLPAGFSFDDDGRCSSVWETLELRSEEAFYGLGESFLGFNRRGRTVKCWNEDALSCSSKRGYKIHPFFLSSRGYAVLLNSYASSTFDMGDTSGVSISFSVREDILDYFIFTGEDYRRLLLNYQELKGVPIPPLPDWAFGLWMSKCSYHTQAEVEEMVRKAQDLGVAIDVVNLDGWQNMKEMGTWKWDLERFPDPAGLISFLKQRGIRICLWIFPYVSEQAGCFSYAEEKGFLVKDKSGRPVKFQAIADMPSKLCAFDFTNPDFCTWYGEQAKATLSMGIDAVKTDFSEALPEESLFYDGSGGIEGHNKYTYLYGKTVYGILAEVKEGTGEQPMIWSRSGYAMSQSIPGAWAGDSGSRGADHACVLQGGLGLAASGISFWGFDMGGFYHTGESFQEIMPEQEDYMKSIQFGMFAPLSRCHGKTPREPWHYGSEILERFITYNNLRHSLFPYLRSSGMETVKTGLPMLRPLLFEFPQDLGVKDIGDQYMLGESILIAPQFDKSPFCYYLPGQEWVSMFEEEYIGPGWHCLGSIPGELPVFLRLNSVIPALIDCKGNIEQNRNCSQRLIIVFDSDFSTVLYTSQGEHKVTLMLQDEVLFIDTEYPAQEIKLFSRQCLKSLCFCGKRIAAAETYINYQYFHLKEEAV